MGWCTEPWPSRLSETTCPPPGPTWHTSRLSTSAPWPTTTQPRPSAKAPVSAPPLTPVCAHRGLLLRLMASLTPQQQTRTNSQGGSKSSSPRLPVTPKVPRCHSTRRSAGSLVRHHRQGRARGQMWQGAPIAARPAADIPGLVETAGSRALGSAGQVGTSMGESSSLGALFGSAELS